MCLNLLHVTLSNSRIMLLCIRGAMQILLFLCILGLINVSAQKVCDCETDNISHPGCGVIPTTSTIINGSPASYPWMVFLFRSSGLNQSFCGGSMINDLQIVTAAHCVAGKTTGALNSDIYNYSLI